MRPFYLDRKEDPTGISGMGLVAQGVEFDDGTVVVRWFGKTPTTTLHQDLESVRKIHCHNGGTVIMWGDKDAFRRGVTDATLDRCENALFGSVGGLENRSSMVPPHYISDDDWPDYHAGYRAACISIYGEDWETCQFGWKKALTIK